MPFHFAPTREPKTPGPLNVREVELLGKTVPAEGADYGSIPYGLAINFFRDVAQLD